MRRFQILCFIFSATVLLQALRCFPSETNTTSTLLGDKNSAKGPLKDLAAVVLTNGVKAELSVQGTLKPKRYRNTSTFPPGSAMRLGLVSTNNEPFIVYGLNEFFPDPVYNDPSEIAMLRVSVQRGRTDIIFASAEMDPAFGHHLYWNLYLTSPIGKLEQAWSVEGNHWVDALHYEYNPQYKVNMDLREGAQKDFHRHIDFWLQRLGLAKGTMEQKK